MTFQESIRRCFTKYADFNGTASRSEYWWFVLFLVLGGAIASIVADRYSSVFFIATLLPLLAVGTRRLRDAGHSGWAQLIAFVPVAGIIVVAILLAQPGKKEAAVVTEVPVGA